LHCTAANVRFVPKADILRRSNSMPALSEIFPIKTQHPQAVHVFDNSSASNLSA
jgi:hypothetical protein